MKLVITDLKDFSISIKGEHRIIKPHLSQKAEITEIKLQKTFIPEETAAELKTMEALVFSFPLYVDGIPAHLLSLSLIHI